MSAASAILVRTHTFDDHIRTLVSDLSSSSQYEVYVLADHRAWKFPVDSAACISLTWETVASLGLPTQVDTDVLWQCGDYGLYVARRELPHIKTFWLYEYDVYHSHPLDLLRQIDEASSADFLSTNFAPAEKGAVWAPCLSKIYDQIYSCTYSILRITAEAVDALYLARQGLTARRADGEFDWCAKAGLLAWPNDETFTATHLKFLGFDCHDFNSVWPDLYDRSTFRGDLIFHTSQIDAAQTTQKLYHSVRCGRLYLRGAESRLSAMSDQEAETTYDIALGRVGSEWTNEEAKPLLAALADRLGIVPTPPTETTPDHLSVENCAIVNTEVEGEKIRFFVLRPEERVQRLHLRGEFADQLELDLIRRRVRAASIIVDVGAGIANHTLYFSKILVAEKIYVIEPDPEAVEMLRINVALNNCWNVDLTMLGVPLSDSARFVQSKREGLEGPETFGSAFQHVGGGNLMAKPGDEFFLAVPVDFIKIDVESMELFVLAGLSKTIEAQRPQIFVNVVDNLIASFRSWVASAGYVVKETIKNDPYHCGYFLEPAGN